ncbi:MAG TPA: hypothetical protein VEH49_10275 [Methylomirabilota bacterium]|nr:hypothetical protein [Methylomirabilota bacterium]
MPRRTLLLMVCASLLLLCGAPARPPEQGEPMMGPVPVFELHSGFWVNLHHFLYRQAREQRDPAASKAAHEPLPGLTEAERQTWEEAVNYYAANYADRDLLFNSELIALKNQLGDFEDCKELAGTSRKECNAGLPGKLTPILDGAAPIYRAHWWPEHDRANRAWVAAVAPLIRQKGLGLAERLADIYESRWPKEKIRVEITTYASWAGAYTTLDPLRVTISSTDPANQGDAALEMVFHEASHGLAGTVQAAIVRECRQRNKAIPRDLWHALLFYTTGEVIKAAMRERNGAATKPGQAYVPYAIREGLYSRRWARYLELLERYWQPYLDGRTTLDDAIARMVSAM